MFKVRFLLSIIISGLFLLSGFSISLANGDDDHSKTGNAAETNQEPYAESYTGNFEIVVTLGNIEANVPSDQKIYLSDYKTNAPIENANMQIEITGIDNSKISTPVQLEPGVYEFSVEFPEIKKYDFLFNITAGEVNDLIAINEVDLAHKDKTEIVDTNADKSFIDRVLENLWWIILALLLMSVIAFIFYKIGRRNSSPINLPEAYKTKTKYEV